MKKKPAGIANGFSPRHPPANSPHSLPKTLTIKITDIHQLQEVYLSSAGSEAGGASNLALDKNLDF